MKKEEIITIIIMSIIITIDIITQKHLDNAVGTTCEKLENLKQKIVSEEEISDEKLEKDVEDIYDEWKQKCKELSFLIEHEGMEEVDLNLEKAKTQIKTGQKEEAATELNEGIYKLSYIKNKQKLNWSNIF